MNAKPVKTVDDMWLRLTGMTPENKKRLMDEFGIDTAAITDMQDDDDYLYLPLRVMVRCAEGIAHRRHLLVIMGKEKVITIQEEADFPPFNTAFKHIRRHPQVLRNPQTMLCLILHVLNEASNKVIAAIGNSLEETSDTISEITRSINTGGGPMGVIDINDTIIELNQKEELVSRCLESQLALARAARYLDNEVPPTDELQEYIRTLRDDISGVKEHATFEHDSVRYLQNAILASLNVKQNQIVKVFTIITAVFLPPTLIASIYGMNFSVMPELNWVHGFPVSITLGLVTAVLPMIYIKYRGWLR
jgi:magnesium transporter